MAFYGAQQGSAEPNRLAEAPFHFGCPHAFLTDVPRRAHLIGDDHKSLLHVVALHLAVRLHAVLVRSPKGNGGNSAARTRTLQCIRRIKTVFGLASRQANPSARLVGLGKQALHPGDHAWHAPGDGEEPHGEHQIGRVERFGQARHIRETLHQIC